jgi:hypothetical protein
MFSVVDQRAREAHLGIKREPRPFDRWALERATFLDQAGAPGLVADLVSAGNLARQAAFVVLARVPLADFNDFVTRLGNPLGGLGEALRRRSARELIAAAFGVAAGDVPGGYLRALMRIKEPDLGQPLGDPHAYSRLWEIMTVERRTLKAAALRYCGPITTTTIHAVDELDPVLVHGEILKTITSAEHIERLNELIRLLRSSISTATDCQLAQIFRQSLSSGTPLQTFARNAIEKADRFPPPPLVPASDVQPLTSAADLIAFGREMGNCAAKKLPEVLLGLTYVYRVEHRNNDGTTRVLALELFPLSDGQWITSDLRGPKNALPPAPVRRAVLERLRTLGAVALGAPHAQESSRGLAELFNVHRFEPLDLALLEAELAA